MTVMSILVLWLAVGLVVSVVFGTAVRRSQREHGDAVLPERQGAEIGYLRRRAARGTVAAAPRKHAVRRHAAG